MPFMLAYVVRRTSNEEDGPTFYRLFDESADLLFVAQPGQPDPRDAAPIHRHIYFRTPDGRIVASLDLPWTDSARRDGAPQYALIHDDAVYALLTGADSAGDDEPFQICSIEVEGKRWVGLWPGGSKGSEDATEPAADENVLMTLYEDVASDLSIYGDLAGADLPEPVAVVTAGSDDGLFNVRVARGKLIQPGLMALALVLLVDRQGTP
jgi:hypothetical protein